MSQRTQRLDELLREEISAIVARDVQDPRVGFVTITSVDVAPDLRHATVWVSVIGQPEERAETLRALGRAMPFVRRELRVLRLKRIPELHLRLDETAERGTRVLSILQALEEGETPGEARPVETLPTPRPKSLPVGPEDDTEAGESPEGSERGRPRRRRRTRR
ncbi:MAG: 30S ribosome-binding factor RbfA [Actinomycetota bacterium]|nr:30S ribosome-binding factor RbfA [Actinomycetota bacterium]